MSTAHCGELILGNIKWKEHSGGSTCLYTAWKDQKCCKSEEFLRSIKNVWLLQQSVYIKFIPIQAWIEKTQSELQHVYKEPTHWAFGSLHYVFLLSSKSKQEVSVLFKTDMTRWSLWRKQYCPTTASTSRTRQIMSDHQTNTSPHNLWESRVVLVASKWTLEVTQKWLCFPAPSSWATFL